MSPCGVRYAPRHPPLNRREVPSLRDWECIGTRFGLTALRQRLVGNVQGNPGTDSAGRSSLHHHVERDQDPLQAVGDGIFVGDLLPAVIVGAGVIVRYGMSALSGKPIVAEESRE